MQRNDSLFEFIKTLTKSEKRYFKLYATTHRKESNACKLFNAIDKQKKYNEKEVLNYFGGKPFLKQLSVTKVNLYKLILKSLESYHANTDTDSTLINYLHRIKILFDKNLYQQSEKILNKAKRLAEKHEKNEVLFVLSAWEVNISSQLSDNFMKRLEEIQGEKVAIAAKMQNTDQYKLLAYKMYSIGITKGVTSRNEGEIQEMKNILSHHLLQNESNAITKEAKRFFYYTHALFYKKTGDAAKSYSYEKRMIELFEQSPEYIQEHVNAYLFNLNNMATTCNRLAKYDELFLTIKKLRNIPEMLGRISEEIKVKVFERSYNLELEMYLSSCQFEKGISIINDIEKGIEELQGKIEKQYEILLNFNCAVIYFIMNEYHKALAWNNKIINAAEANIRQDVYGNARLLNLLIHYELGNEALLENVVKSTYRYLLKKNRLYKVETAILNFIRKKVPTTFTEKERIAAFKELKAELEEITKNVYEKNVLKDMDYIAWLESKIEQRSFAEVLKEKSRQIEKK